MTLRTPFRAVITRAAVAFIFAGSAGGEQPRPSLTDWQWLHNTTWTWKGGLQVFGRPTAAATFTARGGFLLADPRCSGAKCAWSGNSGFASVSIPLSDTAAAPSVAYMLVPMHDTQSPPKRPPTPEELLSHRAYLAGVAEGSIAEDFRLRYRGKNQGGTVTELVASDERAMDGSGSATGRAWDRAIKSSHAVVVCLYDPGDQASRALEGAYQRAASELFQRDGFVSILFAADATKSENLHLLAPDALARPFQVATLPALLVFVDGELVDEYLTHAVKWDLAGYMRRWLTRAVPDAERDMVKARVRRRVVGGTAAIDWGSIAQEAEAANTAASAATSSEVLIDYDDL